MSLIRTLIRPNIKHIQILTSQPIKKCRKYNKISEFRFEFISVNT